MTNDELKNLGHHPDGDRCLRCEPGYPKPCACGGVIHKSQVGTREERAAVMAIHGAVIYDVSCDRCGDTGPCADADAKLAAAPKLIPGLAPGRTVMYRHGDKQERPALVLEVEDPVAGVVQLRVFVGNKYIRVAGEPGPDFEVRSAMAEDAENLVVGRWRWPPRA